MNGVEKVIKKACGTGLEVTVTIEVGGCTTTYTKAVIDACDVHYTGEVIIRYYDPGTFGFIATDVDIKDITNAVFSQTKIDSVFTIGDSIEFTTKIAKSLDAPYSRLRPDDTFRDKLLRDADVLKRDGIYLKARLTEVRDLIKSGNTDKAVTILHNILY